MSISAQKRGTVLPAVVTMNAPGQTNRCFSLYPYRTVKDCIEKNQVSIYAVHRWFSPCFSGIVSHLQKKHTTLIFSEECKKESLPLCDIFRKRIEEILALIHNGTPGKLAVLCKQEDASLKKLLKAISPFAHSLSLVTQQNTPSDSLLKEALCEYGLTVNYREITELQSTGTVILLSGNFQLSEITNGYLINLTEHTVCANVPVLSGVTNNQVSAFLARHPYLRVNPSFLLSEQDAITNLLWKYC